jgi:hypothetical protein
MAGVRMASREGLEGTRQDPPTRRSAAADDICVGAGRGVRCLCTRACVLVPESGRWQPIGVLEGPVEVSRVGESPPGTDRRDRAVQHDRVEQVATGAVQAPPPDQAGNTVTGALEQPLQVPQ